MPDISKQLWNIKHQDEEQQTKALAQNLGLGYIDLVNYPLAQDVLLVPSQQQIEQWQFIPYLKVGEVVKVALTQAPSQPLKALLSQLFPGLKIELAICSQTSFRAGLGLYQKYFQQQAAQRKVQQVKTGVEFTKIIKNLQDVAEQIKKVSTSQLVDLILSGAVITRSSDVHLEPTKQNCRLRFRIDGVLQDVADLSLEQYQGLNSRIKNLAGLKLDIKQRPQDGRFSQMAANQLLDIRVSSMPGSFGEVMVMRLLLPGSSLLSLDQLGFNAEVLGLIREAMTKPHGMILNTGPTGSGKTTTLYAILKELNQPTVKIITIEDPIEYQLPGINQTQVNKAANYTFANALASAVRQDPDIIMVGEIRDSDTAKIALQAALTGHLVLTTLHTNNSASAIPRLLDMGIEPYLLAGSINLIIAQRLVRRLAKSGQDSYLGRIPIAEALKPSSELNELIGRKASIEEFEQKAKELGMQTMLEDGLEKVAQGLTARAEVERVTRE